MRPVKLAVVSTHPIQYYAPVFRALSQSKSVTPRIFFTWSQTADGPVFDPGFGARFSWDLPLRDGYDHVFVPNVSRRPGSAHFFGIHNPDLNRAIGDWKADVVLIYGWNLRSHLTAMRHFKGRIPVLFRGDSTLLDPQTAWRRRVRQLYLRWVYSHVDLAIAVGSNNRDYFIWSGLSEARVTLAPHSVDTTRFGDANEEHTRRSLAMRQELEIPRDALVFLFAAKLIPKKDPILLLDAFAKLPSSTHLVFVGNGELQAALRAAARSQSNVHFLPLQNQQQMPSVYRLGDIYVLPSRGPGETWGLAMNEAMASGRPVIASSRVGGARDLIRTGVTGWIFEAGSKENLLSVLGSAVEAGRDGLHQMGQHAQSMMAEWSTEAAARAIAAAATRACDEHAARR